MKKVLAKIKEFINKLIKKESFDWVKYRNDAARDVLCSLINGMEYERQMCVAEAVTIADELVKQLKTKN